MQGASRSAVEEDQSIKAAKPRFPPAWWADRARRASKCTKRAHSTARICRASWNPHWPSNDVLKSRFRYRLVSHASAHSCSSTWAADCHL